MNKEKLAKIQDELANDTSLSDYGKSQLQYDYEYYSAFIDNNMPSVKFGKREKVQPLPEESMSIKSKADEAGRSKILIGFEI